MRLQLAIDDRSLCVDDWEACDILIGLQLQREQRKQAGALGFCLCLQAVHQSTKHDMRWSEYMLRCHIRQSDHFNQQQHTADHRASVNYYVQA